MLTLVGLGLGDEKDLTMRGIEAGKFADKLYAEFYTGIWKGDVKNLEKIFGKEITILQRSDLEENSKKILEEAKKKKVVLFVQGDPLVATTHSALLLDAKKMGVETEVVHNSSIFSAVADTGLHIYKFGATVTIPSAEKTGKILPESIYKTIAENKKRGLHTLCLLDLQDGKNVELKEAFRLLQEIDKEGILSNAKFVVFSRSGEGARVVFGNAEEVSNIEITNPAVIIICGKLHFTEEEFLKSF